MFCRKCGKKFEGNFCPGCGTLVKDINKPENNSIEIKYSESSYSNMQTKKKGGFFKFLIAIFIIIVYVYAVQLNNEKVETSNQVKGNNVIADVTEYSRISAKELKSMLGKPDDRIEWVNKTSMGNFNLVTYSYDIDNMHYEFIFSDDAVIRLTLYSEKYWAGSGKDFKYTKKKKEDILSLFCITSSSDAKIVADTGYAYRISSVSENVADVWLTGINSDTNTFDSVKITYNLDYFN